MIFQSAWMRRAFINRQDFLYRYLRSSGQPVSRVLVAFVAGDPGDHPGVRLTQRFTMADPAELFTDATALCSRSTI